MARPPASDAVTAPSARAGLAGIVEGGGDEVEPRLAVDDPGGRFAMAPAAPLPVASSASRPPEESVPLLAKRAAVPIRTSPLATSVPLFVRCPAR